MEKMVLKVLYDIHEINNTLQNNIKNSEKKYWISRLVLDKQEKKYLLFWKKVWFNTLVTKRGNFCTAP
jgi:hypothetical protein